MEPEEISRLAQKEREKVKPPVKEKEVKSFQPLSAAGYKVYRLIHTGRFGVFIWIYLVLTAAFVLFFLYITDSAASKWELYAAYALSGIFVLRMLVHFAGISIGFSKYKRWLKEPGFEIKGWNEIGKKENFPKLEHWDLDVSLTVHLKNKNEQALKLINDALFIFVSKANNSFYAIDQVQSGFSGDIRKKWAFTDPLSVLGSADPAVMGYLYVCLSEHLKTINNKYNVIESAVIKFSNKIYHVQSVQVSTD